MDGEMFLAWVEQGLVPALQRQDVVILDNLATHKWRAYAKPLSESGPSCFICRLIPPILIPSKICEAK